MIEAGTPLKTFLASTGGAEESSMPIPKPQNKSPQKSSLLQIFKAFLSFRTHSTNRAIKTLMM